MTERRLFGVAATSVLSIACAGGFVYFPVFAEGTVDISIVEVAEDGSGGYKAWEDIVGAMPGEIYSAIPRVKNNGSASAVVKMCLTQSATDSEGNSITLPANTFGIDINSNWTLDSTTADTSNPATGNCYKYNTELPAGEVTEPLFTGVILNSELGNEYGNSTFSLHIRAEAVGDNAPIPDESGASDGSNTSDTTEDSSAVGNSSVPESPDTGVNSAREAFLVNSGLIFLSAGVLALVIVGLRKIIKR